MGRHGTEPYDPLAGDPFFEWLSASNRAAEARARGDSVTADLAESEANFQSGEMARRRRKMLGQPPKDSE